MKILTWPVVAGAALGIVAPLLTYNGNPGNMGFCAACFLRDTAGSLGLHHAAPLQYLHPELIGLAAAPSGVAAFTPHLLVAGFAVCLYIALTNKSEA